jgi:hypothetical protein
MLLHVEALYVYDVDVATSKPLRDRDGKIRTEMAPNLER